MCAYNPQPLNTKIVELSTNTKDKVEMLARESHERWVMKQMLAGWTYGPNLNLKEKKNPNLVSFDELEQSEQDELKKGFEEDLKVLILNGFEVRKKVDEEKLLIEKKRLEKEIKDSDTWVENLKPKGVWASISFWVWLVVGLEFVLVSVPFFWFDKIEKDDLRITSCILLFFAMSVLGGVCWKMLKAQLKMYARENEIYMEYRRVWLEKKASFFPKK